MLGAYYEDPSALLTILADGVARAQSVSAARGGPRFAAIIHTVTGK